MHSYYVYYKTPSAAEEVRRAGGAVLRAVEAAANVRGRLLRRADDPSTWMEVYEDVADPAAFERALAIAVDATGFLRVLPPGGRRHLERFVPG